MIGYTVIPNNRYNYSEEDVYRIFYKGVKRKTVLYARLSKAYGNRRQTWEGTTTRNLYRYLSTRLFR
jgi:hypothetical protein